MTTETPVKRRVMSGRTATNHVHKNLIRKPKSEGISEFSGLDLNNVEDFRKDVISYLSDASNLSTSTLDRADYEELLEHARKLEEWKPRRAPRKKAADKTQAVAATAAKKVLANVHITSSRAVPPPRRRDVPVVVKVSVPPVTIDPTPALLRKIKEQDTEETPTKVNRVVPGNWRYMAEHANTPSARAWWANYCERRMRGEV